MNTSYLHITKARLTGILMLVCFGIAASSAQDASIKRELLQMFEDQSKDVWVNAYEGFEGHVFPVEITFAHDERTLYGILYYPDTGSKLYLQGEYNDESVMKLAETNKDGKSTGCHMTLQKDGGLKIGFISLPGDELAWETIIVRKKGSTLPFPVLRSTMAAIYEGSFLGADRIVKLYAVAPAKVKVMLGLPGEDEEIIFQASDIEHIDRFTIKRPQDRAYLDTTTNLTITILSNKLLIDYTWEGKQQHDVVTLIEEIPRKIVSYSGPYGRYSAVTPVLASRQFNKWVDQQVASIKEDLLLLKEKYKHDEYGTGERYGESIGVDIQISFIDDRYLSGDGFIYGFDSNRLVPFIYDRIKDEMLTMSDIIDVSKVSNGPTEVIRTTENMMLTEAGLAFETSYDAVYGSKKYYVSFTDAVGQYESMISNRSFRNHFQKQ